MSAEAYSTYAAQASEEVTPHRAWIRAKASLFRFCGLCVGVAVVGVACDDADDWGGPPELVIHVAPFPPPDGMLHYRFDLRAIGPLGEVAMNHKDLWSWGFGNQEGDALYVGVCSPGHNRVGIGVDDVAFGSEGKGVPAGLVEPAQVSLDVACVENADLPIDYTFELATLQRPADNAADLAFSDIRCSTLRTCGEGLVGVEVTCERRASDESVALGVSDSRVVCGGLELPIQPSGRSEALGALFEGTTTSDGDTRRWTMEVAADGAAGCRFEASLLAAPELMGSLGPHCTGWPVMAIALPLSGSECGASQVVDVGYREGSGFAADLIIDAGGPREGAPATGWQPACRAGADVWGNGSLDADSTATGQIGANDAPRGFLDISLEVSLPAAK